MQCRYCLDNGNGQLISPCKCLGSLKYVHIECLKQWIIRGNLPFVKYPKDNIYSSKCELCKSDIYFYLKYKHWLCYDIIKLISKIFTDLKFFTRTLIGGLLVNYLVKFAIELIKSIFTIASQPFSSKVLIKIFSLMKKTISFIMICSIVKSYLKGYFSLFSKKFNREKNITFALDYKLKKENI